MDRELRERDERHMRAALESAREARRAGEVPVGAVVVDDTGVIGRGRNACVGSSDPTAHAEIQAIRHAARARENYRLTGTTLYCTVEPCLMCLGALLHARVETLVFGAADPKLGATARLDGLRRDSGEFNHRFEVRGGVLAEDAARLLVEFFGERRRSGEAIVAK